MTQIIIFYIDFEILFGNEPLCYQWENSFVGTQGIHVHLAR